MPNFISKPLVQNGLVLCLDPAAPKSYGGTGTLVKDLSGQNNHGTLTGGVGYNSANMGSFSFDGVNDYIQIPIGPYTTTFRSTTVCAWFKASVRTDSNLQGLVSILNSTNGGANPHQQLLTFPQADRVDAIIYSKTTSDPVNSVVFSTVSASIVPDKWYYAVLTDDASTKTVRLYLSESFIGSAVYVGIDYQHPADIVRIGQQKMDFQRYLKGNIGPVHIYNRALSAAEVMQNFEAGRSRYGV